RVEGHKPVEVTQRSVIEVERVLGTVRESYPARRWSEALAAFLHDRDLLGHGWAREGVEQLRQGELIERGIWAAAMAGTDLTLRATPAAAVAIDRLRGRARKSYAAFEAELRKQGCGVAGYRLLGAEDGGYSEFCCKRLIDDWRVISTFEPGV